MGIIFLKTIFFFFFTLLLKTIHAQRNSCQPQYCGNNPLPIRFPFSLQPGNCGFPGFLLSCSGQAFQTPVLNFPSRQGNLSQISLSVRDINYLMQEIQLYDSDGCLPRKLLELNFTATPFAAANARNFTFLSCPRGAAGAAGFVAVECLGSSTAVVVATASESLAASIGGECSGMGTVAVGDDGGGDEWLSSEMKGDLRLTWSSPECGGCEAQGGVCGYDDRNNSPAGIVCNFDSKKGDSRGLQVFKIIALSIVIPSIFCSICISIFICIIETRASRNRNATIAAAPPQPPPPPATVGLDEITIESYKKVILGESKRLPGPNGTTCPICLVDYFPKDTIRCIPQCQHCFHSECVDEWLRLNSSCPVCRNSPSHPSGPG